MARLSREQRDEIRLLRRMVDSIERLFEWIVTESTLIPSDLRPQFGEVLPTVRDRLRDAEARLAALSDSDDDMWKRLDDAGLVGDAFKLKVAIWRNTASTLQAPAPKTFVGRALAPLLKLVNSILGSLSGVLPGVELVKEYKEGVEVVFEEQHRAAPLPGAILDLR